MALANVITPIDNSWTEITPTISASRITTYTSIKAYKRNGLCIVDMQGVIFTNTGSNQTDVIRDLPKAKCQSNFLMSSINADATASQIGNCGWINGNGTSINFHLKANTDRCWGTLIYPCED